MVRMVKKVVCLAAAAATAAAPMCQAVRTGGFASALQLGAIRDAAQADEWKEGLRVKFQGVWDLVKEAKTPGAWLGLSDPEYGRVFFVFGDAVQDQNGKQVRAPSLDDHLGIGSITKSMVATVFLQLVQEGILNLDDTVAKLVPDLAQEFPAYAAVTVRQLLGMASGVQDYLNIKGGLLRQLYDNPDQRPTIKDIVRFATKNATAIKPPGNENAGYSTTNYSVLEHIAEALTNRTMSSLVQTRVLGKLGMKESGLPLRNSSGEMPKPYPNAYISLMSDMEFADVGVSDVTIGQDITEFAKVVVVAGGGGAAYATIGDLLTYAESGLGNSLISPAMRAERTKWKPLKEGIEYGLGLIDKGDGWIGHSGDAFGYSANSSLPNTTLDHPPSARSTCLRYTKRTSKTVL